MQFCICIESPAGSSHKASGRWTVEAEDGEHAITNLLMATSLKLCPMGSVWHMSPLCADCPYREGTLDGHWPQRAIHCCQRRAEPSMSGRFEA
jgi:hypothetical protein